MSKLQKIALTFGAPECEIVLESVIKRTQRIPKHSIKHGKVFNSYTQ